MPYDKRQTQFNMIQKHCFECGTAQIELCIFLDFVLEKVSHFRKKS